MPGPIASNLREAIVESAKRRAALMEAVSKTAKEVAEERRRGAGGQPGSEKK